MCEAYKLQMTAREGYVWFLPVWLNKTWYDTDAYNANHKDVVNCTTEEMIHVSNLSIFKDFHITITLKRFIVPFVMNF